MAPRTPTTVRASQWFDAAVLTSGILIALGAVAMVVDQGLSMPLVALGALPLIVLIARFPMLIERGNAGIEVGFDSSVLMFLLCTLPAHEAVALWSVGVALTQVTTDKRAASKRFNIGVGVLGGAVAAVLISAVRGDAASLSLGTPMELLAVALAATGYFATDFVFSATSVALDRGTSVRQELLQPEAVIAVACFVPFDCLGYLAAVIVRTGPWWVLLLLAVPLVTLLIATRAVTRGRENARRLSVLFEAAVRTQTLGDGHQVVDALVEDARRLLRLDKVEVRTAPPSPAEIGAQLRDGEDDPWVVAPAQHRARSTREADQRALEAMAAVSSDAFSRLRLTADMTHLARHDLLTDLPNRGLLLDRIRHAMQMSRRRSTKIALLYLDLDGFKPVNDRFGHAAGDAVLIDVAARLSACVREGDTVARLGGDEFAILLEDVRTDQVDATCERILQALGTGAVVVDRKLPLSASIGVAFGDTGKSAEHLLRNADMAMYQAKGAGKGQYVQYQRSLGRSRVRRLELVEALRAAVAAGELALVYQPVVDVPTGRIAGVEALARWTSNGVNIPPDVFIGAAEESGLVVALGDLVLDIAARDSAVLREAAGGPLNIAVNISAQQLREPTFVAKVEQTVAHMAGADLVLEITERDGVTNDQQSLETMARLSAQGIPFAIDDFGVGFSSIGYLQDLPIRTIKADASFSADIDHDERACALLRSIAMMGEALGLTVVAEGIERGTQMDHLREHVGAAQAQGYLLYRPMPLAEVAEAIRRNRLPHSGVLPPSATA